MNSHKAEIERTFSNIRKFSFMEKMHPTIDSEHINTFLDTISELKVLINQKTREVETINERMQKLTWLNELDETCLMLINNLISAAKDLRTSLIRQYISLDVLKKSEIAQVEIALFKNAIDDLEETYEDLESVFFFLPEFPEFVETTQRLSII